MFWKAINDYRTACDEISDAKDAIRELRESPLMSKFPDGMPKSSSDSTISKYIERHESLQKKLERAEINRLGALECARMAMREAGLTDNESAVIKAFYISKTSVKSIAKSMGYTVQNIYALMDKAKIKLQ